MKEWLTLSFITPYLPFSNHVNNRFYIIFITLKIRKNLMKVSMIHGFIIKTLLLYVNLYVKCWCPHIF